jgi:1-acylglycerone phosphate reductase
VSNVPLTVPGISDYPVAFTDSDMSEIRDLFEVNVFGPMAMIQEFVKLLIASKDGRILQTGSILGIMPLPFSAAYNGTKAAIHALSNSLRVELAPFKYVHSPFARIIDTERRLCIASKS